LGVALNSAPSLDMEDAMWTSDSAESGAIVSVLPKPDPPTTMIHTGSSDSLIKFAVTAARTVRRGTRS
jgi:hypothetical protein